MIFTYHFHFKYGIRRTEDVVNDVMFGIVQFITTLSMPPYAFKCEQTEMAEQTKFILCIETFDRKMK